MRVSFSQHDKPAGEQQTVETYEKIAAGTRSWTIDVPVHVGGYIEIGADKPSPGDRLAMKVKSNGRLVNEQTETLDQPLQSGYVFFSRFITTTIRRPDRKEKSRTPKAAAHHPARTISHRLSLSFRPWNWMT